VLTAGTSPAPVIEVPKLFDGPLLPQDSIPADTTAIAADRWQGFMVSLR
jgi:hypothetical protein